MAFVRLYKRRNGQIDAMYDTLVVNISSLWTWAAVRAVARDGKTRLRPIPHVGGGGQLRINVPVTPMNQRMVHSVYEIVVGDAGSSPNDAAVRVVGEPGWGAAGIAFAPNIGWSSDRDPPRPPLCDWAFEPPVSPHAAPLSLPPAVVCASARHTPRTAARLYRAT
ncbi:MAG: hypothetical protein JNK04_06260 [Myxococcales bacterium]|nr:hypothetical protein [Myxococcales bacterium]